MEHAILLVTRLTYIKSTLKVGTHMTFCKWIEWVKDKIPMEVMKACLPLGSWTDGRVIFLVQWVSEFGEEVIWSVAPLLIIHRQKCCETFGKPDEVQATLAWGALVWEVFCVASLPFMCIREARDCWVQFLHGNLANSGVVGRRRAPIALIAPSTIVVASTTFVGLMKTMDWGISDQLVACVNSVVIGVTIGAVEWFTGGRATAALLFLPLENFHGSNFV